MKIDAIGGYIPHCTKFTVNKKETNSFANSNSCTLPNYKYNPISFGSTDSQTKRSLSILQSNFTTESEELFRISKIYANHFNAKELNTWHFYAASLIGLKKYIQELDEGKIDYSKETKKTLPKGVENLVQTGSSIEQFSDSKIRKKYLKIINAHLNKLPELMPQDNKKSRFATYMPLSYSAAAIDDLVEGFNIYSSQINNDDTFYDSYFILSSLLSSDNQLAKEAFSFLHDLKKSVMIDDADKKQKNHLRIYDNKADAVWRNLNMGANTICIYDKDNKNSANHFTSSFVNLINKPGQNYKNIDPRNTRITVMNEKATFAFFDEYIKDLSKDPKNKDMRTVIVADLGSLIKNSGNVLEQEDLKILKGEYNEDKNGKINIVFTMDSETYYGNTQKNASLAPYINRYPTQAIPSLNAGDTYKYLTDDSGIKFLKDKTNRDISSELVQKAVELTAAHDGAYPDKTIEFLTNASLYYEDKDELYPSDLEAYARETKNINTTTTNKSDVDVIFNTGKTLNDIAGTPMTKADAQNVVQQIKAGIGVKGYVILNANGTPYGGGRKNVAEAIAGEAKIPMIKINAKDFALKDIDTLSENADFSEVKIKKIMSTAKAQAEANPYRTAMIFIENFDNFGSNPLYGISSVYEQKAFSELLSQMDKEKANKDINLLVMGSVNIPDALDENILKPHRFLNTITVYNPHNHEERRDIIDYYIRKKEIGVAGSEDEQEKTLQYLSKTTQYLTVVDLMHVLETAKIISKINGSDKVKREDFTEAFLQVTTGRANLENQTEERKRLVTSHEGGHALTQVIMRRIAEKSNLLRHMPEELNFITLDPRGTFGGATYFSESENDERNFETSMADLICSYGGYSAENKIYNQQGSWGITGDMEAAERQAEIMVRYMGLGPKTGVRHIPENPDGTLNISDKKRADMEDDIDLFLNAGKAISDMILDKYKDFIIEFTDRYAKLAGTGKGIVPAEDFIKELDEWKNKLPDNKKKELEQLESDIPTLFERVKRGDSNLAL